MEAEAGKNQADDSVVNGRDERGRFLPGNPGGPGCDPERRARTLRAKTLIAKWLCEGDFRDLRRTYDSLLAAAVEGDVSAARMALGEIEALK